jgi:hypothetical protein
MVEDAPYLDPYVEPEFITTEEGDTLVTEGIRAGTLMGFGMLFTYTESQEGEPFITEEGS